MASFQAQKLPHIVASLHDAAAAASDEGLRRLDACFVNSPQSGSPLLGANAFDICVVAKNQVRFVIVQSRI